jgi:hypothetical protein
MRWSKLAVRGRAPHPQTPAEGVVTIREIPALSASQLARLARVDERRMASVGDGPGAG